MPSCIRQLARTASHTLILWSSLSMPTWAASAAPALPTPDQFFRSSLESEGAERDCHAAAVRLEPANLKEVNPDTQQALDWLKGWGAQHFRFKGPAGCTDWAFVLRNWQITFGLPVTGVMSAAEVKSLLAERDRTATDYAAALPEALARGGQPEKNNRMMREPRPLDVLPAAPTIPFNVCVYGMQEAQNWAQQQSVMQRRRLGSEFWRTGLPSHWAKFITSNPELGQWMQAHDAERCSARAALRHWLSVIGDRSDIEDPRSTAQTGEVLREASTKFSSLQNAYQKQKDEDRQAYEAEMTRQGALEDALVRTIDIDDISVGARRSDLASRLPQKLCQEDGEVTRCVPHVNTCDSWKSEVEKAQNRWPTDRRELESAKEGLERCKFAYDKSAAGRSSVLFAGKEMAETVLRFERGVLVEIEVKGLSDSEAVRRMLMRRHGAAQTSHEKRRFPIYRPIKEPVTSPLGQTVWVDKTEVSFDEETIFHYTWPGKGFVIELTGNRFIMLKTGAR